MEWYLRVWRNYADFNGRSRRKEYWMFALFNMLVCGVAEIAALTTFTSTKSSPLGLLIFAVLGIYGLAVLVPGLAVSARRLHDIGMSGWLLLVALVPVIGGLVLLVLFLIDSNPGTNQYGPNPKATTQVATNF